MSDEVNALKEAIQLSKENMLNDLLDTLGYTEIDQNVFAGLLEIIDQHEAQRFKYMKALEGQEVVDHYMKNKLV